MDIKQRILNKLVNFKADTNREGLSVFLGCKEYQEYLDWVQGQHVSTAERFIESGFNVTIDKQDLSQSTITVCL